MALDTVINDDELSRRLVQIENVLKAHGFTHCTFCSLRPHMGKVHNTGHKMFHPSTADRLHAVEQFVMNKYGVELHINEG